MLLKMLVGAINFGKGYFSWTANIPLTYHRNAPFSSQIHSWQHQKQFHKLFPHFNSQKDSPRNPKEITETWLVPTTLHNVHPWDHLP